MDMHASNQSQTANRNQVTTLTVSSTLDLVCVRKLNTPGVSKSRLAKNFKKT